MKTKHFIIIGIFASIFIILLVLLINTSLNSPKSIEANKIKDPKIPITQPKKEEGLIIKKHPRNVLEIKIGISSEKLIIKNDTTSFDSIKEKVKFHILNNGKNSNYSDSPKRALILIKTLNETPFKSYITAKNQIDLAYDEIWDEQARKLHGFGFKELIELSLNGNENERLIAQKIIEEITEINFKKQVGEALPEDEF